MAKAKKVYNTIMRVFDKHFGDDAEKILSKNLSPDEAWNEINNLIDWYDEQCSAIRALYIEKSTEEDGSE